MEEKLEIIWSESALLMLAELHEYISERNASAADKYILGIYTTLNKLERHPEACPVCRNEALADKGHRCCIYKNHLIVYLANKKLISILAIIHSSRSANIIKEIS